MASIDPSVASVIDANLPKDDLDEDDLLESFENDPTLNSLREQRLQQLHQEISRAKMMRNQDYGTYREIKDEKTLMDIVNIDADLCVVHFFKPDFNRCSIMDGHLEQLAPAHFDTRFLRINVENAPFLVTKLKVQVLPCVIAFKKSISVDRIIGFEGLRYNEDTFSTKDLEARLLKAGVLIREKSFNGQSMTKHFNSRKEKDGSQGMDEENDWE